MGETTSAEQRIQAMLESFICAQDDIDDEKIEQLTSFINQHDLGEVSVDEIQKRISEMQDQTRRLNEKYQKMSVLFAPDHQLRSIRFGSSFCPQCHMFKNFDKECPYCQFLEITF